MPGELWEIVRADELKVGDVVLDLRGGAIDSYEIDPELVEIAKSSPKNFYPPKLRRYTGHHPDVLMRALKSIAVEYVEDARLYRDGEHKAEQVANFVDRYIRQAEAEIAKERNDGE